MITNSIIFKIVKIYMQFFKFSILAAQMSGLYAVTSESVYPILEHACSSNCTLTQQEAAAAAAAA